MKLPEAMEQARQAHHGQTDKGGQPYIEHPLRVAYFVRRHGEDAMVVALLHDVFEDTTHKPTGLTLTQLDALHAITRREGEVYRDYIERCGANPLARRVKLSDLEDNLSQERMAALPERERLGLGKRYVKAMRYLLEREEAEQPKAGVAGWPE